MKLPRPLGQHPALKEEALLSTIRIVVLYAILAALWILLSDQAIGLLFSDADKLQAAATLKGLLFVAVTSALLFALILRLVVRQNGEEVGPVRPVAGRSPQPLLARPGLIGGIALFSAVFAVLSAAAILQNWQHHRNYQGELLRSVARLKVTQIESWLEERRRDAEAMRSALPVGLADIRRLRQEDPLARQRLLSKLEGYRAAMHYRSIAVVAPDGELLWHTGDRMHEVERVLQETVRRALAEDRILMTDLYRVEQAGHAHSHFDIAVPVPKSPGEAVAAAAVVLRIDVEDSLYPLLHDWPVPSASAETLLFRRDGDSILALNELRHEKESALSKRRSLAERQVLAVQALAPGHPLGELIEGIDYRSEPVLGVAYPIAGTSWWLVAKIDRVESLSTARKEALSIGIASLLTWFAALALAVLFFQRRELQHAQTQRQQQAEKLHALQLLEAIVESSTDAIFAKDTGGRYLLFNKAAARVTGTSPAAAIGKDDAALFPPEQAARIAADDRLAMAAEHTTTFQETLDTADGQVVFLSTKGPLRDESGRVSGLFGIARDITHIAQAENALRKERDLNQRYLDTVQTLMVALDREGRVTMINRFGCALLGYAEAELLGRNWFEIALPQPEGLERMWPVFRRIMNGEAGADEYFENEVCSRDGRRRLIAWHNAVLADDGGRIVGTLSSGEDISDRKLAEAALRRQAGELSARNEELERFNRAMVGRELDMIALKRRVNKLSLELGRPPPFDLGRLDEPAAGGAA